jgi:hypothetical protein
MEFASVSSAESQFPEEQPIQGRPRLEQADGKPMTMETAARLRALGFDDLVPSELAYELDTE